MTRKVMLCLVVLCAGIGIGATVRNKPPYVNERSLMRGARCTVLDYSVKNGPSQREEIFDEVKSITVSKTYNAAEWVIKFSDFQGCELSFWTDEAVMDKPTIVNGLSSY